MKKLIKALLPLLALVPAMASAIGESGVVSCGGGYYNHGFCTAMTATGGLFVSGYEFGGGLGFYNPYGTVPSNVTEISQQGEWAEFGTFTYSGGTNLDSYGPFVGYNLVPGKIGASARGTSSVLANGKIRWYGDLTETDECILHGGAVKAEMGDIDGYYNARAYLCSDGHVGGVQVSVPFYAEDIALLHYGGGGAGGACMVWLVSGVMYTNCSSGVSLPSVNSGFENIYSGYGYGNNQYAFCGIRSSGGTVWCQMGSANGEISGYFRDLRVASEGLACAVRLSDNYFGCWNSGLAPTYQSREISGGTSAPSNSCASPTPSFPNIGELNYSPTSVEQEWTYSSGAVASCSYSCVGGYSGYGCLTAPPSCTDGILNQDETDIDTGGVCGYDYVPSEPIPEPTVNATCGLASKNYAYTGSSFEGSFCGAGTLSGTTVNFPEPGSYSNWTCLGSGSGSNTTCYAYRYPQPNSCASPVPNFDNLGNVRYDPVSVNQSWTFDTGATLPCSYSCVGGYSGEGCSVEPTAPPGADTSIWSAIFKPISDMTAKFTEFYNWIKTAFEIVDLPGNPGISFGESGEKFGGTFSMGSQIVALGADRVSVTMNVNGTQCAKEMVLPNGSNVSNTGILTVHTKKSYLYGGRYNCYNFAWTDEKYDLSKMVVDGKFTYMKDAFGNDVAVSNSFSVKTDFANDVSVNVGFDLKIFGYSVVQEPLSKVVGLLLDASLYVLDFLFGLGSNFLDLFAMGTVNYGGENYGPFFYTEGYDDDGFGKIAFAGSTWSYFSEPKTGDNWVLDGFILGLAGWYVSRKFWKKG